MRKSAVLGALAVSVVFAGAWYLASREAAPATVQASSTPADRSGATAATPTAPARAPAGAAGSGAQSDSRLQALMVSPDNGLIEFVKDADGRVIKEIDQDPSSPNFGKVSREYTYSGNQVVALTTYKHLGSQIQISRIMVSFKPNGTIEGFHESTNYEPALKTP
jgi:hypothetical protein